MGNLREFYIEVNEDIERYVPVNNCLRVSGAVIVHVKKDVKVEGLSIRLVGVSKCLYSANVDGKYRRMCSKETLLKETRELLDPSLSSTAMVIKAGDNTFPFSFEARSSRIPSSYKVDECCYGTIRYKLKARIVNGRFTRDSKYKLPIRVYNPPIIRNPQLLVPVEYSESKAQSKNGFISFHVSMNKSTLALRSDDTIEITMTVDNQTLKLLQPLVFLRETLVVTTPRDTSSQSRDLYFRSSPGRQILPNSRKDVVKLVVGPLDDRITSGTILPTSNILVSHELVIKLEGSGMKAKFPVLLGTSPASFEKEVRRVAERVAQLAMTRYAPTAEKK